MQPRPGGPVLHGDPDRRHAPVVSGRSGRHNGLAREHLVPRRRSNRDRRAGGVGQSDFEGDGGAGRCVAGGVDSFDLDAVEAGLGGVEGTTPAGGRGSGRGDAGVLLLPGAPGSVGMEPGVRRAVHHRDADCAHRPVVSGGARQGYGQPAVDLIRRRRADHRGRSSRVGDSDFEGDGGAGRCVAGGVDSFDLDAVEPGLGGVEGTTPAGGRGSRRGHAGVLLLPGTPRTV